MTEKNFDPKYPAIVALAGQAGTGKTITASELTPQGQISMSEHGFYWDKYTLARPIYEIVSILQTVEGNRRQDRVYYGIHEVLLDLFGRNPLYGAPSYDKLVRLVESFGSAKIQMEGKPRSFMQHVGATCRAVDPDCFVRRLKNAAYQAVLSEDLYGGLPLVALVDDMRYYNEAEFIKNLPNGVLIRLDASPEVRSRRLYERDGVHMTEEQMSHESETSLATIPEEWFDVIINTDDLSVEEQVEVVKQAVLGTLKGLVDA